MKDAIRNEERGRRHRQALRAAAGALGVVLGSALGVSPSRSLGFVANDVMGLFVGWMGGTQPVENNEEAEAQLLRAAVMDDFSKTVLRMEHALPASVLSPGP